MSFQPLCIKEIPEEDYNIVTRQLLLTYPQYLRKYRAKNMIMLEARDRRVRLPDSYLIESKEYDYLNEYISKLAEYRNDGNETRMFISIRENSLYFLEEESKLELVISDFNPEQKVRHRLDCESIQFISHMSNSIYINAIEPYFYPLQQLFFSKTIDAENHNWSMALMYQIKEHMSNYNGFIQTTDRGIIIENIEYIHPLKATLQRMVSMHNEEVKINMLERKEYYIDDELFF